MNGDRLPDDKVGTLLNMFVLTDEAEKQWRRQWHEDHKRWLVWLSPSTIDTLTDADLRERFLEYYTHGAGRYRWFPVNRDKLVQDVSLLRSTLKFLLDENIDIGKKLQETLGDGGVHAVEGMGRNLVTSILEDMDPAKYGTWNTMTQAGLMQLGRWPDFGRGDDWGGKYQKVVQELSQIRQLGQRLDFIDVDHFMYIVGATEEGIDAVDALRRGAPPSVQTSSPVSGGYVILEKLLEEFIVSNFDKVDFGSKLELYCYPDPPNEDSTARQVTTDVGFIDVLARDVDRNEVVVIELKRGRPTEVVVGQILKYMGWVKEHLAGDREVRGIIIAASGDMKLKYALKLVPSISLYAYTLSFGLKKEV
jgi:Endonuclease NucS C-terminal domain